MKHSLYQRLRFLGREGGHEVTFAGVLRKMSERARGNFPLAEKLQHATRTGGGVGKKLKRSESDETK